MTFNKNDGFFWGGVLGLTLFLVWYNVFYLESLSSNYTSSEDNFDVGMLGSMVAFPVAGWIGSLLGTHWLPWEEWSKKNDDEFKEMFEKKIKCRSCNTLIKGRNAMERSARGVAGTGAGGATGAIVGTMLLPGFGTLIGGAVGATTGSSAGAQVSDICEKCCSICVKKKSNCNCLDIVAYCVSCGDSITRRHYSGSRCYSCSEPVYGDDL